jgi:hypothetical protein
MAKQFKDTKVGQFLSKVAPKVLDAVGDFFPPAKVLTMLLDKEEIPLPERMELEKLIAEYEAKERADYLADVQNAREMQKTALTQEDKFSKRFVYYLTTGSLLLGFAYIFFITFFPIPQQNQRFADTILGVVITVIFATIYNFFFGSSKGSADKNVLLTNIKQLYNGNSN